MSYFQTDDNVKLYYETFGRGKKTILFIHGWMDWGESFKIAAGNLAKHYKVIVYDHRGHGRSETPKDGYGMVRLAMDLRNLIEYLEPENLTLVGYSMGSHVLYEYVKLFGDQDLDKLVISVMSPTLVNEKRPELSLGGEMTAKKALEQLSLYNQHYTAVCEAAYPIYLQCHPANEKLRSYYSRAAKLDSSAMIRLGIAMYAADYWDVLPTITRPTLILSAENDMYSRTIHEEQARLIPDAQVVIVPGCGHMMLLENPETYMEMLGKFIG